MILSLLLDLENFVSIFAVEIGSDDRAAAVGPVKNFSRSFFEVSLFTKDSAQKKYQKKYTTLLKQ